MALLPIRTGMSSEQNARDGGPGMQKLHAGAFLAVAPRDLNLRSLRSAANRGNVYRQPPV
jgi:hypothetical protein